MIFIFPMDFLINVCKFVRAYYSHRFKGDASYGYCATKKETYYGFQGHLTISFSGVISGITVTAAHIDEREQRREMIAPCLRLLIGDKGYISQKLFDPLLFEENIQLETPKRRNMKDNRSSEFVKCLMSTRRTFQRLLDN